MINIIIQESNNVRIGLALFEGNQLVPLYLVVNASLPRPPCGSEIRQQRVANLFIGTVNREETTCESPGGEFERFG
jgi:hypothetical protein